VHADCVKINFNNFIGDCSVSSPVQPASIPEKIPVATPLRPRKRAILVGASSGLGAALARRLAAEGYIMALLSPHDDLLHNVCDQINAGHTEVCALPYKHDVTEYEAVPSLILQIISDLGGLDLFVYLAGVNFPPGLDHLDFDSDRRMMEVNVVGAMAWLAPVAALFKNRHAGQIVAISSVAADRGRLGNPGYNASKAALDTYLEGLRNRLTRHGVHVLTVRPGFMKTEMLAAAQGATPFAIEPEQAAADISRALRGRRQVIYTPPIWRWIMLLIVHTPSLIFRRLSF
jgi:NAD(P)-dependent dehydrogenase (short-subunit alcohol dehydrogenase family)